MTTTAFDLGSAIADAIAAEDAEIAARDAAEERRREREKREADERAVAWFTAIFGAELAGALAPSAGEGHGYKQAWFTYRDTTFIVKEADSRSIDIRIPKEYGTEPSAFNIPLSSATRSLLAFIGRNTELRF